MKQFVVDSSYHQFYVADLVLKPDAPVNWTDDDVSKHHLTEKHIAALSPVADIAARVTSCGPDDPIPDFADSFDFEVCTEIEVPAVEVGVFGWPWGMEDRYRIQPGRCSILFRGYATERAEAEEDHYLVKILPVNSVL
ncbi:hypothetical protein [Luteolibacter luteus]|uniref:Uncharacterized protein n=1 Tax=Luteolibacter luteus TaxID=2728835 RepID=A0A858RKB8_9BACT|nr:hypothetical protein [Luteolibacter luteus]QJE97377.1 hypothetical protein HHL09_16815 [Luteolibacter luteus]